MNYKRKEGEFKKGATRRGGLRRSETQTKPPKNMIQPSAKRETFMFMFLIGVIVKA